MKSALPLFFSSSTLSVMVFVVLFLSRLVIEVFSTFLLY